MSIQCQKSDNFTMFLPAFIDDYGFNAAEFRVFSRIMRRCLGNDNKGFYESIPNLAKSLVLTEDVVRKALKVLVGCGAVTKTEKKGKPDQYNFQTCDKWQPAEKLPEIRKNLTPKRVRKPKEKVVTDSAPVRNSIPLVVRNSIPPVVRNSIPKGIPIEGIHTQDAGANTGASFGYPLKPLYDAFPEIELTPSQVSLIQSSVTQQDAPAWRRTIEIYRANHDPTKNRYLPDKVGNVLSVFQSEKAKLEKKNSKANSNGQPKSGFLADAIKR